MQRKVETLLLCRTPFQAVMLCEVLKSEATLDYNLIYLTQDNSEEDVHYYNELSDAANHAQYLYVKHHRYDILNHIQSYRMIRDDIKCTDYNTIMIASINNLALRKMAIMSRRANIISFDDGLAHVVKNSMYLEEKPNSRMRLYEMLFHVPTMREFRGRIGLHYSMYPGFKHIFPRKVIRYIDPFNSYQTKDEHERGKTFFIGQPFSEIFDDSSILKIKKYIRQNNIDYYVRHPREPQPLVMDIPLLNKGGRIAEEAIFKVSNGKRPQIYGGFSTVLINISPDYADKVMLLRRNVPEDEYFAELGKRAGCKIEYI